MDELSKGSAFRHCKMIFQDEINFFHEKKKKRSARNKVLAISEEGDWFPQIDSVLKIKEKLATALLEEITKKDVSLEVKKYAKRAVFTKGKINAKGLEILASVSDEVCVALQQELPVGNSIYTENKFKEMLTGKISEREFCLELMRGVFRPENFVTEYFEENDFANKLFSWFLEFERDAMNMLRNSREFLVEMISQAKKQGNDIDFNQILRRHSSDSTDHQLAREDKIPVELINEMANGAPHPILRSIAIQLMVHREFFKDNMSVSDNMRKIRDSDAGDILHSFYIPYVDIFRTDGYFANLTGGIAQKFECQVLNNLEKLPGVIEHSLENLSKS